jgi:Lrp/AsnC family transcriptional regulator
MEHYFMDKIDRKILEVLQKDASISATDIADRVGLSKTPCWRRILAMKRSGIIQRIVAILDPKKIGVSTTVFVMLKTGNHSAAWLERFSKAIERIPEIVEIHRLSGDIDYLMRIVVPDIGGYDVVYKRLIASVDFVDVSASFVLETMKMTTALPLNYTP